MIDGLKAAVATVRFKSGEEEDFPLADHFSTNYMMIEGAHGKQTQLMRFIRADGCAMLYNLDSVESVIIHPKVEAKNGPVS